MKKIKILPKKYIKKKYSDVNRKLRINAFENLNFEYNFMADNNLKDTNLNSIASD